MACDVWSSGEEEQDDEDAASYLYWNTEPFEWPEMHDTLVRAALDAAQVRSCTFP
jgi:hypothetical protein